ncbi:MAG: ABC transporter substrate-binding protein [Solirubrobacteraceae bacterium]|nr:ABC transporter substrate-binding protein [Patulibacter sp.]
MNLPGTRVLLSLLPIAALGVLATGCGEMKETQSQVTERDHVTLMLDYFPNADHAAIYAAQADGDFARAGLDVTIEAPSDATTPLRALEAGQTDFAISYEPDILLARAKGAKVQGVEALVQKPLTAVISLPKHPIETAADFKGKTIGTAGLPYQQAYIDTILQKGAVDPSTVKTSNLGFNLVGPLVAGRVDGVLGAFWNYEGVQLAREKKKPVITKIEDLGVPIYNELVLTASEDTVRNKGEVVRRLVQAIGFGAAAVKRDPEAAIEPLLKASKGLDKGLQLASLKATIPVMFPEDTSHPYGWMDVEAWAAYCRWMQANHLITDNKLFARAFTNEYLAGEGVGDKTDS